MPTKTADTKATTKPADTTAADAAKAAKAALREQKAAATTAKRDLATRALLALGEMVEGPSARNARWQELR
jgi:hypothetical protein